MRKLLGLALALLLCPVSLGCAAAPAQTVATTQATTTQPAGHTLYVGYGRADITPEGEMPIGDPYLGKPKMATEILDPLYATCVAFSDEENNTVLLFHMDLGNIREKELSARTPISEELGIPEENIMICATHTHATPRLVESHEGVMAWNDSKVGLMLQAARDAMATRSPAQIYTTSIKCPNMNFVRHYVMSDGTYAGDNFGTTKGKEYVSHTEDADNVLQLVKFVREEGKDVVLANWQGHPHRANGGGGTVITSDIVGTMRDKLEQDTDCLFAYFSGASGNINNASRIPGETITADYVEHGHKLAEFAQQAQKDYVLRESGRVQILRSDVQAQAKHSSKTSPITLYAFSIGDVAFVTAPFEMFNAKGMEIKQFSPFPMTFVCTLANGRVGYIPDQKTCDTYQCYEQTQCNYAVGTAEQLSLEHILMLKELFKTAK